MNSYGCQITGRTYWLLSTKDILPAQFPLKFYYLPKIHKDGTPLRPIASSRGSITDEVVKELANIILCLVGQYPHHLKKHAAICWTHQKGKAEGRAGYGILQCQGTLRLTTSWPLHCHSSIYTSTGPLTLWSTCMVHPQIVTRPESCLKRHTSSSRISIMNSSMVQPWWPISPLITKLFMEEFEFKAISFAPIPLICSSGT